MAGVFPRKTERLPDGEEADAGQRGPTRRQVLGGLGILPAAGITSWAATARADETSDAAAGQAPIVISPSDAQEYRRLKDLDLDDPKVLAQRQKMPTGKIGNLTLSRLIAGSNLISVNMHARDLPYVSGLARAYNTEDRVFMTLKKCEEQGCNAIILKDHNFRQFNLSRYWSEWGGKMVWLADVITADIREYERRLVQHLELGAASAYLWGGASDQWFHRKEPQNIVKAYEIMRKYDIPVGIGSHRLEPIAFCEREGLKPDYYMLTLHHDQYWSAHPKENRRFSEMYEPNRPDHDEYHDNMWCHNAEETVAFMQDVKVPWIAFKVLAAGAIPARRGIQYAFDSGADFICLGMFDFQVEQDAELVRQCSGRDVRRKRPWA